MRLHGTGLVALLVLGALAPAHAEGAPPVAAPSASAAPGASSATKPEDRAIFDRELAREKWGFRYRPPTQFWTPSTADVLKMEAGLPAYLREQLSPTPPKDRRAPRAHRPALEPPPPARPPLWEKAGGYKRQYIGLVKNKRRLIWGNFFCSAPSPDWRREPVGVHDGGDCYFQVLYDVDTGRFSELMVNGEA
jgi:hypothetical protein